MLTTKTLLQGASLILQESTVEARLRTVREKRRAIAKRLHSSGIQRAPDRTDLTVAIDLADYLVLFADKDITPKAHTYESDDMDTVNGEIVVKARGVRHYMSYPSQFVGTLPTKPPTHVWANATTDSVWAPGDPKPVIVPEVAVSPVESAA